MRYGWALLTMLAWGLWFGGMGALFLFVSHLFVADRATAVVAAPRMFFAFERYQFAVAAMAIISAALWRLASRRRSVTVIFVLLALTTVGTLASAAVVRPPMEKLRLQGQSSGAEFDRLHKVSERLYGAQAVLLLIVGVILPAAMKPTPRKEPATADPTAPPA